MSKITLLIFFWCFAKLCIGQQDNKLADSLKMALQNHPSNDTNRVTLLLNIADAVLYDDPQQSMQYTNEAGHLSEVLNWQQGTALFYRQRGLVHYVLSDNLNAMDDYEQALKVAAPLHSEKFNASIFNNMANIYADMGDHEKALDYYTKYLTAATDLHLRKDIMNAYANIGTLYTDMNNYNKALDNFEKALPISESDGYNRTGAFILSNMGSLYFKMGDNDKSLAYFQKSIQVADEAGFNNAKAPSLNGMAKIYFDKGDYSNAEKYSKESYQLAKEINEVEWQSDAMKTLSNVYEKQNSDADALQSFKTYITLRDSVMNDEKKQELTRKEMEFDFQKKEALSAAEINKQRIVKNAVMGGAAILLLGAVTSLIFYKRRRDAEGQKKEAEFKAMVADTEMKALRLQMNPHFIFNSLNSISDYVLKHDTQTADYYLSKFSKLMRMTLEHSEQKAISLEEDLKALELYMQLESLRLNNKFTYEIKVEEDIDPLNTLIPPMILQPFVENSIWHGIACKEGKGLISIKFEKDKEMINCIVEDNGIGREKSAAKENPGRKSWGMKITNARIDIINKLKKSKAAMEIYDLAEGMRVEVRLPLELSF